MKYTLGIAIGLIALFAVAQGTLAQTGINLPSGPVAATKPVLEVTKTSDVATTNPNGLVTYTVTIKNAGDGPALGLTLDDTLPIGFTITTTGKNTFHYAFLGQLDAGKTVSTSYTVNVAEDVAAGTYVNAASVTASNHDPVVAKASVDVTIPEVKGATTTVEPTTTEPKDETEGKVLGASDELTSTGVGQLDVFFSLLGSGLIAAGIFGLRRTRRA